MEASAVWQPTGSDPAEETVAPVAARTERLPLPVVGLGIAFLVLYAFTLTHWYTFDTVSYATSIRRAELSGDAGWLFHPHHLLFNAMGLLVHQVLCLFVPDTLTITAVQVFTATMGAFGLGVFALWLYEETRCLWTALTGAAALGGTFGWWFASTDGRANLAGTAVVLLVLWALRRARRATFPDRWCAFAGGFLGFACLLHQSHGLFLPVALLAALFLPAASWQSRARRAILLAGVFVLTIGVPYVIVAVAVKGFRTQAEVVYWLTTYGQQGTWWNFDIGRNVVKDGGALYKLFTGQNVVYGPEGAVVRGNAWGNAAAGLWAFLWGVALFGGLRGAWRRKPGFVAAPLLALVIYSAFFTVWDPGHFVFWFAQGAFLMALIALGWREGVRRPGLRMALSGCVVVLAGLTYAGAIVTRTDAESNPHLRLARSLQDVADLRGLVIASGMGSAAEAEVYVPYFSRMQVVALHRHWAIAGGDSARATASVRALIDRVLARGNSVFLLGEATHDPAGLRAMERRFGVKQSQIAAVFDPYERLPVEQVDGAKVFRLYPRPPAPPVRQTPPAPPARPSEPVRSVLPAAVPRPPRRNAESVAARPAGRRSRIRQRPTRRPVRTVHRRPRLGGAGGGSPRRAPRAIGTPRRLPRSNRRSTPSPPPQPLPPQPLPPQPLPPQPLPPQPLPPQPLPPQPPSESASPRTSPSPRPDPPAPATGGAGQERPGGSTVPAQDAGPVR